MRWKMKNTLEIILPLPVSVNHYLGHRVSRGKKKFVQTYKTQEALLFENTSRKIIQQELKNQNWQKPAENKYIRVDVVWFLKKKGMDTNNLYKMPLDIMEKCGVYSNDSMVLESTVDYFIDTKNPRCHLKLTVIDKEGVFKNQDEKLLFCKANCHNCSKKKTSCTYFKKLLENRIITEVNLAENVCYKLKTRRTKTKIVV